MGMTAPYRTYYPGNPEWTWLYWTSSRIYRLPLMTIGFRAVWQLDLILQGADGAASRSRIPAKTRLDGAMRLHHAELLHIRLVCRLRA